MPENIASMPEILTETQLKRNLLNIARKVTRYIHHKEFLKTIKQIVNIVKAWRLSSISLCVRNRQIYKKRVKMLYVMRHSNCTIILLEVLLKNYKNFHLLEIKATIS